MGKRKRREKGFEGGNEVGGDQRGAYKSSRGAIDGITRERCSVCLIMRDLKPSNVIFLKLNLGTIVFEALPS